MKGKGWLVVLFLAPAAAGCFAQPVTDSSGLNRQRPFLGVSAGLSYPLGGFSELGSQGIGARAGTALNLVTFGCPISENLGFAAAWFAGTNPVLLPPGKEAEHNSDWHYRGLMAGPRVAMGLSERLSLELKQLFGFCVTRLPVLGQTNITRKSKVAFAHGAGLSAQVRLTPWLGLHAGAELLFTQAEFDLGGLSRSKLTKKISTVSPVISLVYRFR